MVNIEHPYTSIISKVASDLIKDTTKGLLAFTQKKWKGSKLKSELEIEKAFQNYIEYIYPTNQNIKTLLYKNVAKPLYNFYEPVNVKLEDNSISTQDITAFFENVGNKVIVTGTGGIGKTTLLKHLFLNSIDTGFRIPLLIELRNLNTKVILDENFDIIQYIFNNAKINKLDTDIEYFKYALEAGLILVIFDGLDELSGSNNRFIENEIIAFSKQYFQTYIIVSSRPSDQFIGWHEFVEVKAQNLTKNQALSLINKLELENESAKQNFYKLIEGDSFDKYYSFASIPLLLTIMLLTYEMNASIPDNLNDFYEMAFLALFQTHDASKSSFSRDMKSKMTYEHFKDIFCHISFNSYYSGEYNFTEASLLEYIKLALDQHTIKTVSSQDYLKDMQNAVCMIIKDGFKFTFTHRSFQEYFAAVFISKQSDEVQEAVFKNLAQNTINLRESIFFDALKFMQPNRYNKNFLYAILKDYKHTPQHLIFDELISSIYFKREDPNSYTIIINNLPLWNVHKEIFQKSKPLVRLDKLITNLPLIEGRENKNELSIDFITLKEEGLFPKFVEETNENIHGIKVLMKWLKDYEAKTNIVSNPLSEILGLKKS